MDNKLRVCQILNMISAKEAKARIKINKLLEQAGWRFFSDSKALSKPANIQLEQGVKITQKDMDTYGDDFEKTKRGVVDYLLLDQNGFPLVVLEAKRESKNPLDGKEQARKYAHKCNVRFVILSNGNLHYFWDLEIGNPEIITKLPTQESLKHKKKFKPDNTKLCEETINEDYIASSQQPDLLHNSNWSNPSKKKELAGQYQVSILRPYQVKAIHALQQSAKQGNSRFLFEMATGTGKTLLSAGVIKLFLRTGNAKRILFLVDRLELEEQAHKNFKNYLKNDYISVIYKEHKDDWSKAEIVISTVQSLMAGDKYRKLFSPTDFDLLISDEAHRSIGGNSRAVFEYFTGYKLGLTATPRDYLKNIDAMDLSEKDQRKWEKRQLLDTYITFGCEKSEPTFKYSLMDSVKDGYLINPVVVDARTDITTELLSEKGYNVKMEDEEGKEIEQVFYFKDFERKFFSKKTNIVFCKSFLENALKDPISGEIGKSIIFCISQKHASKITQILNQMAHQLWPEKYNSDFALQITSNIENAQQSTVQFANNKLNGYTKFLEGYKSSKTRVCVTVRMMTTGYDCQDILNLCLMRPVFSPTDFIQMKGRGTRKFMFKYKDSNNQNHTAKKKQFKLFDFFAVCEFFENQFNYDKALPLPQLQTTQSEALSGPVVNIDEVNINDPDYLKTMHQTTVGAEGMRVDRELWGKAKNTLAQDRELKSAVKQKQWEKAIAIAVQKYEDKPELYLNLEKIRKSEQLDRRITWREVLERVFGLIDTFPNREELLQEECNKFISIYKPSSQYAPYIVNYIRAYITDPEFRSIIDKKDYASLNNYAGFDISEFKALNGNTGWRTKIPEYIKNYINLNTYKVE